MLDSGLRHISHEVAEADTREDMGYIVASMSLEALETGKISAKVIDVLMRQPDGTWKFHATCWNSDV